MSFILRRFAREAALTACAVFSATLPAIGNAQDYPTRVNWFTNKCCMESTAAPFALDIPPHTRYKSGCAIRFIHKRSPLRAPCSPSRTA